MLDFSVLPAAELASLVRSGAVAARELVESSLTRLEGASDLHAVAHLDAERALAAAHAADEAAARGRALGPLHGLPATVKAVFAVAAVPFDVGLEARRGVVASEDATVVRRLRRAGAIIVGTTNTPPGGEGGQTDNPLHGRTVNPYDPTRTPGGSSGGEAVVQAVGASAFGLGSDSGGSIRVPAGLCGVAGLKPTSGRVPATGAFGLPGGLSDPRTQIGPIARHVADLAVLLPVVAGPDGADSALPPVPLSTLPPTVAGLRVAVYEDDERQPSGPAARAAVRSAAGALAACGADVVDARPDRIGADSLDLTRRYWSWDDLPGGATVALLAEWDAFRTRMLAFMADVDALLCPVARHPARSHDASDPGLFDLTLPFSLTGQPVAVVRAGSSPEGLPVGVQLAARVWHDEVALALAGAVEAAAGGWQPPARVATAQDPGCH